MAEIKMTPWTAVIRKETDLVFKIELDCPACGHYILIEKRVHPASRDDIKTEDDLRLHLKNLQGEALEEAREALSVHFSTDHPDVALDPSVDLSTLIGG